MSADFEKLREIFLMAVEQHAPDEWDAYLDRACATDEELRRSVAALLKAHAEGESLPDASTPPSDETGVYRPLTEGPGSIIGSYKLLEQIGEGGFGVVFMAEQQEPMRRKVALKILKPGMDTRQVTARFEAERQALALMDHPNIARVLEGGETASGRPYFVMELVKGIPITDFCNQHQFSPRQRLELFVLVCQAVQHAHQKGIIHRDLKPTNVLVTLHDGTPVPKVIDFGIAKGMGERLTDKTLFTSFAQLIGTPLYMSPEQAALSGLDVDTRSDIYSLGVLLYELLTGTTPFDSARLKQAGYDEIRRIICEEEPLKPSTRISTLGQAGTTISTQRKSDPKHLSQMLRGELDWIVMKGLEKDRNRRYGTANGLARDIERYLHDEPVQACPPSAGYRFRKFARRHKIPLVAGAAVCVALVLGAVVSVWQAIRATGAEREAKTNEATALAAAEAERLARRQTRQALDTLTDAVVEELLGQQLQVTDQHREFLRKVLAHYKEFAATNDDTPEGRQSRADGSMRVGWIRYRLGEYQDAEPVLQEGLALRKQLVADFPTRPDFRKELAGAHDSLAALFRATGWQAEAEAACRDAVALQKQLVTDFPTRPDFRWELARSHIRLGDLLRDTGRLPEAETTYRDALALCKQLAADSPADPDSRQILARSHHALGIVLRATGRLPEAEAACRDALAIQKQLVADFPTRPNFRYEVTLSQNHLGNLLSATGRPKQAESAYRDALALQKQLAAELPNLPHFRHTLAGIHLDLGHLLRETGRLEGAETAYRDALTLCKQLVADFPIRFDFRETLARSHNRLGNLLLATRRPEEAETACREALALYKQLVTACPNRPDFCQYLARSHNDLGNLLCAMGRLQEAEAAHQAALTILTRQLEMAKSPECRNDLAGTLVSLADLHYRRQEFAAAVPLLEQARPHYQTALRASPKNPAYRQSYRQYLKTLTQIHLGLADHGRADMAADQLTGFGYDPANDAYAAACFLCRCIPLAAKDAQLAKARRQELAQTYADRAIATLRHAIEHGFKDVARLKMDSDLDPLRTREEFKRLLAEREAKTKE